MIILTEGWISPPKGGAILIVHIKALQPPRAQPGEPMDLANIARQRRAFARGGRASSADARPIANALGVRLWPDSEAPAAGPAGPPSEGDLPCPRRGWHGSVLTQAPHERGVQPR